MFGRRSEGPLNGGWTDESLERAVEAALDVEPAPEFLARVRTRVASEAPPSPTWNGWPLGVGAAAIASICVAAVIWVPASRDAATPPIGDAGSFNDRRLASKESAVAGTHVNGREEIEHAVASATAPRTPIQPGEAALERSANASTPEDAPSHFLAFTPVELRIPAVVLSPREQRAIHMLLNPISPRTVESPGDVADVIMIPDLPALAALEVPAVEVVPLAQIATAEGGRP